jgi:ubiquinone/menaquinone biosynthesis C-methylase UbiE
MKDRIFDEFDSFAKEYREIHSENIKSFGADSYYFAEMRVKLLLDFEKNDSKKILDFGCGDGASEIYFQKYFSNWVISGIDVSGGSILEAKEKEIPNTSFSAFDGLNIPAEDNSFDVVFIAGVLHHVSFDLHNHIMKEINRVLKTGGHLYLFEHNPLNPLTKYLVKTCIFDKDAKLLHNRYTNKVLLKNGFIITHNFFIIFFPRTTFFKRLLPLEKFLKWVPFGGKYFIQATKVLE